MILFTSENVEVVIVKAAEELLATCIGLSQTFIHDIYLIFVRLCRANCGYVVRADAPLDMQVLVIILIEVCFLEHTLPSYYSPESCR